jgi:hypothetical protein
MAAPPASKRARPAALNAAVTTLAVPGLGLPRGIFVLADGIRLVSSSSKKTIFQLPPSGRLATLAGNKDEGGELKDGEGISARFKSPYGLTVDRAGNVVVADFSNNAVRTVTRAGAVVSTLAGNGEAGFVDGQGPNARFNEPHSVVVTANGDFIVSEWGNHSIRVQSARWWATGSEVLRMGRGQMRASTTHPGSRWTRRGTCWWPISATALSGR